MSSPTIIPNPMSSPTIPNPMAIVLPIPNRKFSQYSKYRDKS